MNDAKTLETTLKELQQKLQRELKIRQAADQMLSTAKEKETRIRIKGELDKSNKRITVYSNDLERLKHSLSTVGNTFGITGSHFYLILMNWGTVYRFMTFETLHIFSAYEAIRST